MDFNKWNLVWSIAFGLMALTVIIGNSLVISILLKRTLRKRPHFLLVSLAIADLLVGLLAIPLYMMTIISQKQLVSTVVFDSVDMFTGFASVFTISAIALERMYAIAAPMRHRRLAASCYAVAIAAPWILSLIVTSTRVLLGYSIVSIRQFLGVIITFLSTPLLLSVISYCVIWRMQATRVHTVSGSRARREAKLSKTLFLITGCFFFTWLPFHILIIVVILCKPCQSISMAVVFVIKLLQFSNSVINFIIYCFRMPKYRRVLKEMFSSHKVCTRDRYQWNSSVASYHSAVSLVSFSSSMSLHSMQR